MMRNTVLKLILMITVLFFVSCDSGKKPDQNDENADKDPINDIDSEIHDESVSDPDENDDLPDIDEMPSITIKCPESVDEETEVTCKITSENNTVVIAEGDSCKGMIDNSKDEIIYTFTPSEYMGPGTCIAKVRDTRTDETAETEVTVNEVNTPPYFTSEFNETLNFYEKTELTREFYFSDEDLPKEKETDPGYVTCSIRDNTCGFDIFTEKDMNKCVVKGTMPEESGAGECEFKVVVTDGYGLEAFQTISAVLRETNESPQWETEPVDISVVAGDSYDEINGVATDPDLPNSSEGDPGYLTCNLISNHCSFDIAVETQRDENGKASCEMSFTSGDVTETCQFRFEISDGEKKIYSKNTISVTPFVSIECPESVNEGEEIVCDITAKGGNPGELDMTKNTCRGEVFNEEGSWKYRYTTTEEDGPKFCDAAVGIDTATASATVEIKEVNNPPEISFSSGCVDPENANATEGQNFFCNVSMSDVDRPNSDPEDPGYVTCKIKNNTCGSWLTFTSNCNGSGKPDEESGGTQCSYTVEVTDGYGEKTTGAVTINIAEINSLPTITDNPDSQYHLMTNENISFTYSASDSDLPNSSEGDPGYLKCYIESETAQSVVTVSGEGAGTVTCGVEIDAHSMEECGSGGCLIKLGVEDGLGSKRNTYTYIFVKKCVFFATEDGTGTGGRTWDDAFGTIQEAVDESWEGCEIWVKRGTYTNPAMDNSPVLTMKDGVKIIGGFQGHETYDHVDEHNRYRPENPIIHSVLDGEDTSYHVVVGALNETALDGFIVTGGNAVGTNDEEKRGGGMYNKADYANFSDYFVANTIFTDNYAEIGGGAVYNEGFFYDPIYFYKTEFINNSSGDYGGAVLSENAGHITYLECEFSGNSSNAGGAIAERSSRSNIDKCVFKDNEATTHGGALELMDLHTYTLETQVFIVNSLFHDNSAGTLGGAISGGFEQLTIDHSTFANNSASSYGAVIGTEATISNSVFWNNEIDNPGDCNITYSYGTGNTTGTGNINSMPPGSEMFVNEISDFHLHSTSPAIGAADPSSTVSDDIEGNTRSGSEPKDMGAYEFQE
jgi:predicted outer membrane repeat protein